MSTDHEVFADTYYFIAMLSPTDGAHARVEAFNIGYRGTLVTTQFVLAELADGFSKGVDRSMVADFIRTIEREAGFVIIPSSDDWFHRGLELFGQRLDKAWSLTDFVSFVVMNEMGLHDALTADHHFEQAGFTALLKEKEAS